MLPIHPSDTVRKQIMAGLFGTERVHFTAPLPYDEFCRLLGLHVAGMAIAGKPKGAAQSEAEPINVKSLLP